MHELGARTQVLPAPPLVVWGALVDPHAPGSRAWLDVRRDEVEPRVLSAEEPTSVVWSSLWPSRPADEVHLALAASGRYETALSFRWLSPDDEPDSSTLGHVRKRINTLLYGDLRYSFGQ